MDNSPLKQAGLKTTLPRLRVLAVLENSKTKHLSAEDIYKELFDEDESISLSTIYRVLTQFETAGLLIRNNFEGDRSVYELNNEEHHDHMVCVKCGSVTEFTDNRIESLQDKVAEKHHFLIQDHSLTLYGLCRHCKL